MADISTITVDNVKYNIKDAQARESIATLDIPKSPADIGAVAVTDITQTLGSSTTKIPSEKAVQVALASVGQGDMKKVDYDANGDVKTAGGIDSFVSNKIGEITYPVTSVNNKKGDVKLTAADVGAMPDTTIIPVVNDAKLTIQKNGAKVAEFTANDADNITANIIVPTQASDINAVPDTRKVNSKQLNEDIVLTPADIGALSADGNAATATKLASAKKINGVAFDGSADVTGAFTSGLYDGYLQWGGTNIANGVSPIDAGLCSLFASNKAEFSHATGITVEYSNNDGATWVDYDASDDSKRQLLSLIGTTYFIGKKVNTPATIQDKLRITVNANDCGFYTALRKILINVRTNGARGCKVVIEQSLLESPTIFTTVDIYEVAGWSGWNSIPLNAPFGGPPASSQQIASIRFIFSISSLAASLLNNFSVLNILFYGVSAWATTSAMAKTGHLYEYDMNQNAIFPAQVRATKFIGDGSQLTDVPYPVTSVSGKTGAVSLVASDVGAVSTSDVTTTLGSSTTKVPSEKAVADAITAAGGGDMLRATYDPTNAVADAGGIVDYVANNVSYPVTSVNTKTGAVTLNKSDIGLSNVDNVKQYSASNPPPYPESNKNKLVSTQPTNMNSGDIWYKIKS
jgi:hypothetical protein